MRIAFIGVGSIGRPMAAQLITAGHALTVHDARREAAADLPAGGAVWAESPSAAARQSDLIATCLPGPAEMEEVCLGARGIVAAIPEGALYIDHTTNSPDLVRRVHATLAA